MDPIKCPKCNEKMDLRGKHASYDFRTEPKKKYTRKIYWCKKDDIWISLEMPS